MLHYRRLSKSKCKHLEAIQTGETTPLAIYEPIKIGVFTKHPSMVKDNSTMLYYESHQISK